MSEEAIKDMLYLFYQMKVGEEVEFIPDPDKITEILDFLEKISKEDREEFIRLYLDKSGFLSCYLISSLPPSIAFDHRFKLKDAEYVAGNINQLLDDVDDIKNSLLLQVRYARCLPIHLTLDVYSKLSLSLEELLELIEVSSKEPYIVTLIPDDSILPPVSNEDYQVNPYALEYLVDEKGFTPKQLLQWLTWDTSNEECMEIIDEKWKDLDEKLIRECFDNKLLVDVWKEYGPSAVLNLTD